VAFEWDSEHSLEEKCKKFSPGEIQSYGKKTDLFYLSNIQECVLNHNYNNQNSIIDDINFRLL